MLVDIHAKSSISPDCSLGLDEVIKRAKDAGLDGIAFCETLSSARCQEALDACKKAGLQGFIGVEIPTDKGVLIGFVPEIDDFYLAEEWRQLTEIMTPPAAQVIQLFTELGGVVIASRPYDLEIAHNMGDLIFTLDGIQAVEVFNSRVGQLQCDFALEAATFMNVPTVGGSDPNGTSADGVGTFATFFESKMTSQRQFVEALLESNFWAVQIGKSSSESTSRKSSGRSGRGDRGGRSGDRGGRGGNSRGRGNGGGGRGGNRRGGNRRGRSKRD